MRYALTLAYDGTNYHGWQVQETANTVQAELQKAISTIKRQSIPIIGCGRTDTGVHAWDYTAHFDIQESIKDDFLYKLNAILPKDIAIHSCLLVADNFHARFDANLRSYQYKMHGLKDPFNDRYSLYFGRFAKIDWKKVQEGANLIKEYDSFFPFCKSNNDLTSYTCQIKESKWTIDCKNKTASYKISANRFLRGMVRLIVGMCLNLGLEKVTFQEVQSSLENQTLLSKSWSVPALGLALIEVKY